MHPSLMKWENLNFVSAFSLDLGENSNGKEPYTMGWETWTFVSKLPFLSLVTMGSEFIFLRSYVQNDI